MTGPELTPEDVKEILRLVDESRFDEFELETPRFSVRFRRAGSDRLAAPEPPAHAPAAHARNGLVEIVSPMVGHFYAAPGPGEPPFVAAGSHVEPDTQVCVVEVMKLMNAVAAGVRGTIEEVCVEDAAPVAYGDVLFRVRPDA